MATEVFTTETIRLLDDAEVDVRPLPIGRMRKFMRIWTEHMKFVQQKIKEAEEADDVPAITEGDLTDAQFDAIVKMCALGLGDLQGERNDKDFIKYLEDVLDERTAHRILYLTGGLALGDQAPNQRNQVTEAPGTN